VARASAAGKGGGGLPIRDTGRGNPRAAPRRREAGRDGERERRG
jgi:hypothetical protein